MSDDPRSHGRHEPPLSDTPTGPLRTGGALVVEAAGRTDKGRVRPGNEDAFGLEPPTSSQARAHGTLLIVSDGMGGHAAGEVASNLAVETVQKSYYRLPVGPPAEAIRNAISRANTVIFDDAERVASRAGMGCTIVVMVVRGGRLTVGHVGDSRGYLIRGGRAQQITRDHSWVAMQVEEGILTPEQAEHHPNRSLLMRALGRQPVVEVEIGQHQLQAGDVLLLCSDGLTGVVHDDEIAEYASRYMPAMAAEQLISLANSRGAPDNVTVVAAAISRADSAGIVGGSTTTIPTPILDTPTPRMTPNLDTPTPRMTPPLPTISVNGDTLRTPLMADTIRNPSVSKTVRQPAAQPAGTPIVITRDSMPAQPAAPRRRRQGRIRWRAGALAAFGLAAGLVLLTLLGPRSAGDPEPTRTAEAPVASKSGATPQIAAGQAAPTATAPLPAATGIPSMAAPGAGIIATPTAQIAAAPPPPAATSASGSPLSPVGTAVAGPVSTAVTGPASTAIAAITGQPGITPLIPGIVSGRVATPTQPAASPPALTGPTSVPTATPTSADSGSAAAPDSSAGSEPPAGADGASGAPGADGVPPEMSDEPPAGEPAADAPGQAPRPASGQPGQGSRAAPGSGITLPNIPGLRPRAKPGDD